MSSIGIIGGSSLYELEDISILDKRKVDTPFGDPSDQITIGKLQDEEICFLPRHGRGHRLIPSEINNRANIYALKKLGVDRIFSVSAVGSLKEDIKPRDIVLVDQFVDRTNCSRKMTFFGEGIAVHIPFADPVCAQMKEAIFKTNKDLGIKIHDGGTYVNMEGPAFSTKAESYLYKSWGIDVIGMTLLPEAKLSREAGICYCPISMVTDYDCWHLGPDVENVSVEMILETMNSNIETVKKIITNTIRELPGDRNCYCKESLSNAIMTDRDFISEEVKKKLDIILKGYVD